VAIEDRPVDVFDSTVFKAEAEHRANDSLVVILMQEVHKKIDEMDKKLTQHMTDETLVLAEEIAKLMNNAFPGSDPAGHRVYHETQMAAIADNAAFWKSIRNEVGKWGILSVLGFILIAAWRHFLEGPSK
jgi:hypothetical protein